MSLLRLAAWFRRSSEFVQNDNIHSAIPGLTCVVVIGCDRRYVGIAADGTCVPAGF